MAVFTMIGAAIFGAGTFLAGATAFLLKTAAGIGLNLLAQALAGKPKQPVFSIQTSVRAGGDVPRSAIFGRYATAGSRVWHNTWGQSGETPNAYLTQVFSLSDMPSDSLAGAWWQGQSLTLLTGEAHADYGVPVQQYRKNGTDHLWIKFYNGLQTVADNFLMNKVASPGFPYESTRVGRGITYVIVTSLIEREIMKEVPEPLFVVQGMKLYDPSKDTTAGGSGSQRWNDTSTWGGDGDNLPAVQIYNICRGIRWGGQWQFGLQTISAARVPALDWIPQIEKCRAVTNIPGGGTEPAYRSGMEVIFSGEIASAIEELLTACQGKMPFDGVTYRIVLGEPDASVAAIDDDVIISTAEQDFDPFRQLDDTVNGIAATFVDPQAGWETTDLKTLLRPDLEVLDGGRRLLTDFQFHTVASQYQCQRLMDSALKEARRERRHTFTLPPGFYTLRPGNTVTFNSVINGYVDKLFRVESRMRQPNLDILVDLIEIDPSDFDYDPDEYVTQTPPQVGIIYPPTQPIVDWNAVGVVLVDPVTGRKRPGIQLSWDGTQPDVDAVRYFVRLKADGSPQPGGSTQNVREGGIIISQGLIPDTEYEVQGVYWSVSGREFEPSAWLTVRTPEAQFIGTDLGPGIITLPKFGADAATLFEQRKQSILGIFSEMVTREYQERKYRVENQKGFAEFREEIELIITDQEALAQALETVIAQFNDTTAETTFRMTSVVAPSGVAARIEMQARVGKTGTSGETTWTPAGFIIDVIETTPGSDVFTGRITNIADQVEWRTSAGDLTMYFDALIGRLTLDSVRVKNAQIDGEVINDAGVKVNARFRFGNRLYGEVWTRRVGRGWTISGNARGVQPQLKYTEDNRIEIWSFNNPLGSYSISNETVWPWPDYIEVINPTNQAFTRLWPDGQIEIGDYDGGGNWVSLVAKSAAFKPWEMDPFNLQQKTSFVVDSPAFICVPNGVTQCTIKAWGAGGWGGDGASGGRGFGGAGGYGQCTFPVTPGELIRVTVPLDATTFMRVNGAPFGNVAYNFQGANFNFGGQPFSSMTGFGSYGLGRTSGGNSRRYEMATPGSGAVVVSRNSPQLGDNSIICVIPGGGSALGPYHGFPGGDPSAGGNVGSLYGKSYQILGTAVYTGAGAGYEGGGHSGNQGSYADAGSSYLGLGGKFYFAPQCTSVTQMAQTRGSTEFPPNASDPDWIALGSTYGKGGWSNISGTVPPGAQGIALLTFS